MSAYWRCPLAEVNFRLLSCYTSVNDLTFELLEFYSACHKLYAFPCLVPFTWFPARCRHRFAFSCFTALVEPATCFSVFKPVFLPYSMFFAALGFSYMFYALSTFLHVFPRLAPVIGFPTLDTSCMFSRAWHQLRVLPALGTSYRFSRA